MRRWLKLAVAILAGAGFIAAVWVFASSLKPPVQAVSRTHLIFDVSDMLPGEIRRVDANGKPHFIVRPNEAMIASIQALEPRVGDTRTPHSSDGNASFFVYAAYGHACIVEHVAKGGDMGGTDWPGGFIDPCRGYRYDYAGRFVRPSNFTMNGRPAEMPSLRVPYYILRDGELEIRMLEQPTRE